jgi:hypothetical protein
MKEKSSKEQIPGEVHIQVSDEEHEHPFYGMHIIKRTQKEYIEKLMEKYKNDSVNDELKKKVWDELQMEKYHGRITIPFKIAVRLDPTGKFPDYIEIILDTKL